MTNNSVPTLQESIERYRALKFSVIPIKHGTKVPALDSWLEYQSRLATDAEIEQWFTNNHTDVAIICGQVSGGLVVTEFDAIAPYNQFAKVVEEKLGRPLQETTPVIETARGYHVYWLIKELVASTKFPNVEIRSDGNYVLAPPSIHPEGKVYEQVNPEVKKPYAISSLTDIGIDVKQVKPSALKKEDWITTAMLGVDEGLRDDTCTRLAGHFLNSQPPDIVKTLLYSFADRCKPAFPHQEVDKCVESVARNFKYDSYYYTLSNRGQNPLNDEIVPRSIQDSIQVVYKSPAGRREYGELAHAFDEYMSNNPGMHHYREVAEIIGTKYSDRSYIQLLQRRSKPNGDIRRTGDKIQWINKDWQRSALTHEEAEMSFLDLALPFGAEEYIRTPKRSQIVVAGDIGSGKTHWAYALAELNVGNLLPIRHFVNEMGRSKATRNLDDFPKLYEHLNKDYYLIDLDREELDVKENLDPDGLNIYDYYHLSASQQWFLYLQREMAELSKRITTGAIVVCIQKKRGQELAYGGEVSRMQCDIYFALNVIQDLDYCKQGRIDIIKAREYAIPNINPEMLSFVYKTAPKHGKLVAVSGKWAVMDRTQEYKRGE